MEAGIVSQDTSSENIQNNDEAQNETTAAIQSSLMPGNGEGIMTSGNVHMVNRRETLSRRPSYRKILNDLSSNENNEKEKTNQGQITIDIADTSNSQDHNTEDNPQLFNNAANIMQDGNTELQLQQDVLNSTSMQNNIQTGQSMQEFSIANLSQSQQNLLQQNEINSGNLWPSGQVVVQTPQGMQAYAIQQNYPSTLLLPGRGVTASMPAVSPQQLAEDASRKRESRLMKNRDAAKECRRRKKEYVKCLETRVAVLEHQNQQLIDELKTLKELYVHKQVDPM